jgi:hypothetical protein
MLEVYKLIKSMSNITGKSKNCTDNIKFGEDHSGMGKLGTISEGVPT